MLTAKSAMRMLCAAACLAAPLTFLLFAAEAPAPNRYAMIVGIEDYGKDIPRVEHAEADAKLMYDYMKQAFGVPAKNIKMLLGEKATLADIGFALDPEGGWFARNVKDGDTLFFFYAGHGMPSREDGKKEGYLVPYGSNIQYTKSLYSLSDLRAHLQAVPVKQVVVFMDSCFSGQGVRSITAPGERILKVVPEEGSLAGGKILHFSSSKNNEISSAHPDAGQGIFTYFLAEGLRGGADADKDGAVTLRELHAFVEEKVVDAVNMHQLSPQTPTLHPAKDDPRLAMKLAAASKAYPAPAGKAWTEEERTKKLVELIFRDVLNPDKQIDSASEIIARNPNDADAYRERGSAYREKDLNDLAIADYSKAIALKPDYAEAYNDRGWAYRDKGLHDLAIADYSKAIALNPDSGTAYHLRAFVYEDKGLHDRAIKDFNKVIALNPDSGTAYHWRAFVYVKKGLYDRAIEDVNKAIALLPDYAQAYNTRADAYEKKGLSDKALEDYKTSCDLGYENACAKLME